jgi:hypothetical protein
MSNKILTIFCSLIFVLALTACTKPSQPTTHVPKEHPYVTAKVKDESIKHSTCPTKIALDAYIVYPQDTGNAHVDQFFEKYSDDFLNNAKTSNTEVLANSSVCTFDSNLFTNADFDSYKTNHNILGIFYKISSFVGGAHEELDYRSYNFDLTSGKELNIIDLFPRPKSSLPKLYSLVYSELCTDSPPEHSAADTVFGGTCGKDKTAPKEFLNLRGPLDNLAHLTLSAHGAHLNFLPLDLWSWSQGPYSLFIPKDKLIEMGAKDLWGNSPKESPRSTPNAK